MLRNGLAFALVVLLAGTASAQRDAGAKARRDASFAVSRPAAQAAVARDFRGDDACTG